MAIQNIISRVMDWIHDKISAAWTAIVAFILPILDGIRSFFIDTSNAICETVSSVMERIHAVISAVLGAIWSVVTTVWSAVSDTVSDVLSAISGTVSSVWNAIISTISSLLNQIKSVVSTIWDKISTAVSKKILLIRSNIEGGFQSAVDFIKGLASQAFSWGADIIGNIVNGIRSRIGSVTASVTEVADTIRSFLHFSVPDVGPLTDFESWMPDFMKGLADGIDKSKKFVETAVSGVADAMQLSLQTGLTMDVDGISGAMMRGGGKESVINNYTTNNNHTFTQNNTSPKALNRYEIYRQTKNLIHMVKAGR